MSTKTINRLPANTIRYSGFYNLIKELNTYIEESNNAIKDCVDNMVPINRLDTDTILAHILNLAQRNNVILKWLPNDLDDDTIKSLYIAALRGSSVNRSTLGTKDGITKLIRNSFPDIVDIQVINNGDMTVLIELKVPTDSVLNKVSSYLAYYLLPEITGVDIGARITTTNTMTTCSISSSSTTETNSTSKFMNIKNGTTEETISDNTGYWTQEFK